MKSIEELVDRTRNGKRGRIIALVCLAAVLAFTGIRCFTLAQRGVLQLASIPSSFEAVKAFDMAVLAVRISVCVVFVSLIVLGLGLTLKALFEEVFRISKNDVLVEMWDRIKRLEERVGDAT